jgi:hypothetical protein
MKPLTILTLGILLAVVGVLIYFREWYAIAALSAALVFFILRRLRNDMFK